jgi:two-component system, OmpR family, sensor histidine kinase VicK
MKRRWLPRRMQPQLMLLISAILLVVIAAHSGFTQRQQVATAQRGIENQANALVKNLAVSVAKPLVLGSLDELDNFLLRSLEFPDVLELLITDTEGRILSHVRRAEGKNKIIIDAPGTRLPLPQTGESMLIVTDEDFGSHMDVWVPVVAGDTLGWVHGDFSTAALDSIRQQTLVTTVISSGVSIVFGSLLLFLALRRPVRALRHARNFAVTLEQSDGNSLSVMPAPVEIEDLQLALHNASLRLYHQRQELARIIKELQAKELVVSDRNAQLDAIFTLSPDGFISFDPAGRVQYANPAFLQMTGLSEALVLGQNEEAFSRQLADLCLPSAKFCGVSALSDTNRDTIELSGPIARVLQVGVRQSQSSSVLQILYFRDITHETEVDRMKSEFLSTAAHELRTPMASIYGYSELLIHESFDEATRKDLLETVHRQSVLMASIINELLDLARIEARRGKDFEIKPVAVDALVDQTIRGFRPPSGRPAPVCGRLESAMRIHADAGKIQQVFTNLLANAYKYSPGGGEVHIGYSSRQNGPQAMVGITVSDQGMGMSPEQLARVFERFYRADASGKIPGTGLGMSIVKEIVDIHHGSVEIASALGTGTQVTVWLPAYPL